MSDFYKLKNYWFFLIILIMAGCEKESPRRLCGCSNYESQFQITVTDSLGNDLLNPNGQNNFVRYDIKLFYVTYVNGEEQLVMNRNYTINKGDSLYFLNIYLNDEPFVERSVTLIEWNTEGTDTLECEYLRSNGSTLIKKVWLNSELKWPNANNGGRKIVHLIKYPIHRL